MSVEKRKFWCAVFETVGKVVKNFHEKSYFHESVGIVYFFIFQYDTVYKSSTFFA